ncbi:hypothetical protein [Kutzneria buriramensis]|uniref:Uncharacterized protein n=1 Tax=Kutzneria buriramensis TaxID=1045776 RepID=A0A3E0HD19_9PSEU|nr:hypothetical protein [Kutzneria buriramensis]REH42694.1 hypothetical protein BCF44_110191 [Kutzneria buriramensis]
MLIRILSAASQDSMAEDTVELTAPGVALLAALREVVERQAHYARARAEIEKAFKADMGTAEVAAVDGAPVFTYRTTLRTSLTQKLLKQHFPDIAAMCSETKRVRTFNLLDK